MQCFVGRMLFFLFVLSAQTHPEESLAVELDVVVILVLVVAKGPGDEGESAAPRERRRRGRRRETAAAATKRRRNRWRHRTNINGLFFRAAGHRATRDASQRRDREPRSRREGAHAGARGGGQPREGSQFHAVEFFFLSLKSVEKKKKRKQENAAAPCGAAASVPLSLGLFFS